MKFPAFPRRQTLTLPFGFKVRIRVVTRKEIDSELKGAKGLWITDGTSGNILIADDQPYDERIDTLAHELFHALTDYQGWLRLEIENPFRTEVALSIARDLEEADE